MPPVTTAHEKATDKVWSRDPEFGLAHFQYTARKVNMAPENSQGESPEKKAFSNFVNFFLFKWANAMQNTTNSIAGILGFGARSL